MEDIAAFIGFLLLTGSLFLLAKFVLEQDEFRHVRNMSPFFAVLAAVLFWGAGRLDPALSTVNKFFVSGGLTLALILAAQTFQRKRRRPLVALVLALTAAALAIPLILLVLWFLFAWFPSTFFTAPPTEHRYESRLSDPQLPLAPARTTRSARNSACLLACVRKEAPSAAAKIRRAALKRSVRPVFAMPLSHSPAKNASA